jgi:hypothetical protein
VLGGASPSPSHRPSSPSQVQVQVDHCQTVTRLPAFAIISNYGIAAEYYPSDCLMRLFVAAVVLNTNKLFMLSVIFVRRAAATDESTESYALVPTTDLRPTLSFLSPPSSDHARVRMTNNIIA